MIHILNNGMFFGTWCVIVVYISFFRSFCLRLSSVVVAAVDSERSKSHDVFELSV